MKITISRIAKISVVLLFSAGLWMPAVAATGNISTSDKYAWSENTGWMNFRPSNGGVTVNDTYLSGYVWAENIGHVKLGNDSGGPYNNTNANDWGVNRDNTGNLSGYAWSENVGWINFNTTHSQVTIDTATGSFDGYAWSENVGWIRFKNGATVYNVVTTYTGGSVAIIPTMPEWAMIIFMILTGMMAVCYLKRMEEF